MSDLFLILLSNGNLERAKSGSVSIYSQKNLESDFWLQTDKTVFINFAEIESVISESYYQTISKEDILFYKNSLKNIFDLDISYETFFMRLVVSVLKLFDISNVLVLSNAGMSSDLAILENIFQKYLDGTEKSLVIIDNFEGSI